MIVNLVYLVNIYTALLKMYFAAPVLYVDAVRPVVDVTVTDGEQAADDKAPAAPADDAAEDAGDR